MITVAGLAPSMDLTYLVERLELGRIHRPTSMVRCAGGKPLNLARAATALGADVAVVAVLGGWTGDWLAAELTRLGIAVDLVATPAPTRTCVSISAADSDAMTELYSYADPIPADVWATLRERVARQLPRRPGWLAIPGGAPRGLPSGALADVARLAHAAGCRVAADTHGPSLLPLLDERPDLLKINRDEAAQALGCEPSGSLAEMATALRSRTGGVVVLTDGAAGSLGVDAVGQAFEVAAPSRRGRFPVGSGDAYLGGLLTSLDSGADLPTALRLASAAGIANAQLPGPGNLDMALVRELAGNSTVAAIGPAATG